MRKKDKLKARNEKIRDFVNEMTIKYPHWNYDFILQRASDKFFLSSRTIEAIVKGEGIYAY